MVRVWKVTNYCATTFVLLGIILVFVYFNELQQNFTEPIHTNIREAPNPHKQDRNASVGSLSRLQWKMRTLNQSQTVPPKCKQKQNVKVSGFESFSPMIQDFLYYRHCHSFPLILDVPNKCEGLDGPKDIFLLLVIKSSPKHYERREILRKTWAKDRSYKGKIIRRIFIIGSDGSSSDFEKDKFNKLVMFEHQQYNDILQWDFKDSFFNLTLKQILFLEWMERRCPQARFLLNGDDDVFAHTDNIVEYLQSLKDNNGSSHLFTGDLFAKSFPIRDKNSKYFVPPQVYEKNVYPPYCGGGGFLLSGYTALVIYKMSAITPIIPIDDVYMGMCLAAMKLKPDAHMGIKTLRWWVPSKNMDKYDPCYLKELLLLHKLPPIDLYFLWKQVHNPNLKCTAS